MDHASPCLADGVITESPGIVGDPEIWLDDSARDRLPDGYEIVARRYSHVNGGGPYYVARRPD